MQSKLFKVLKIECKVMLLKRLNSYTNDLPLRLCNLYASTQLL
uniref:Uncharacterized protein n=1 Tax=Anguilla anguilla TaxID=7936 RepID=A0A0E9UXL4_ANGAN